MTSPALNNHSETTLRSVVNALRKGHASVGKTPKDCVYTENKWQLFRYRPTTEGPTYDTPILLVPSLINRPYVLDLMPGKSLAEWLVALGFDLYILDWGTPGDEDRYLGFDEICDGYLGRAIRQVAKRGPRNKAHVLGYCLGGTLSAIHAAVRPRHLASLTALAAPVSFSHGGLLADWTRSANFDLDTLIRACGNVPWPLMQSAFQMLRPTLWLSKLIHVLDRLSDTEFLEGFAALETWGNDNVAFPGECYRQYIDALYRRDELAKGTFRLSGEPAKLENIACPTFTITFEHDNIVPTKSAAILHEKVGAKDKQHLHLSGGHVGSVVSRGAKKALWPAMAKFWAARDL